MTAPALDQLTSEQVRSIIDSRTAGLPPVARKLAAERIARAIRASRRATRYPTPGTLAAALDPTTIQTPALDIIDRELVRVGDGELTRLGIFMPPQEGKSTRTVVFGALWLLLRNPHLRIGIASYEAGLAIRSGKAIRDLIESHGSGTTANPTPLDDDLLSLSIADDSASMSNWHLAGYRGGVLSVGIGGAFTGRALDVLIVDDPVKDARAADSALVRQRAWEWYTQVARVRLSRNGPVIVVQTRWHEDDLSGRIIAQDRALPPERRKWALVNVPAQGTGPIRTGDDRLPDSLDRPAGEYMLSARGRTADDFEDTRREVGERAWSAIYQQNPTPAEGAVFRWSWFTRTRRAPDAVLPASARTSVAVDPSAGGSDEAGIVGGFRGTDGRAYVTHDRSGVMSSALWARAAWLLAVDTTADVLVWEKNLAGPTMAADLRRAWELLRRQAVVLQRHATDADEPDAIRSAAVELARADAGGTDPDDTAVDELAAQLTELTPDRLTRILAAPITGYCQLRPVSATTGKRTRATPVAVAYETGRAVMVGTHPELEQQAGTWQEGQDSPDRMDAMVWLVTDLLGSARRGGTAPPPAGNIPTGPITRT